MAIPEAKLRKDALRIFRAALHAADPAEAVLRNLHLRAEVLIAGGQRYRLPAYRNLYVTGAGKASAAMAVAVERLLGRRLSGGLINVKDGHTARLRRVKLNECAHPVPDERGVAGARRIAEIAAGAKSDDLILCLISGGASALLALPAPPITLAGKQRTTDLLLRCGANIHEMNCVRKHLSSIKGGRLAALAHPAAVLSLILSDVIGDKLDVIGSGPTAADWTTFDDALAILRRFDLADKVPASVRNHLEQGAAGAVPETPKPGSPQLDRTQNLIVGSNYLALDAAAAAAKSLGYRTLVLSSMIEGETRDVAKVHCAIAKEIQSSGRPLRAPACVISGGETTVTVRGSGKGGRNQEFVLAGAIDIAGLDGVVILSGGTDGNDGPTDAAGAVAGGSTLARAKAKGLDARAFLDNNDSYRFFDPLGGLIRTGPTGTNVMDVRLALVG